MGRWHYRTPPIPTFRQAMAKLYFLTLGLFIMMMTAASGGCSPVYGTKPSVYFSRDRTMSFMCVQHPSVVLAVYQNHLKQLNECNLSELKRERTPQTQVFAGPRHHKGEENLDKLFEGACKPRELGGLKGLKYRPLTIFIVGNVANVKWVATAPFLKEPYIGSDAYVTCGDKMLAMVSSFDIRDLKFKN